MQSFSRGFAFLKQAWQMALADKDLIKPSIYALFAGFAVTLIALVPMGFATLLFGGEDNTFGSIIMFILGAILVFVQYTVTYTFSAMTVYLIYGYLSEGDGRMDKAWAIVKRDFLDLLSLAAASTLVNIIKGIVKGKGKNPVANAAAGLIDTLWTEATYLILPAMVIEDLNLKDGLVRATQIVRKNLLLVGISTVGVKAVTGLIGFLLGALGIGLGFGVGFGIVSVTNASLFGLIGGISLGVLVATPFILAATVLSTYTATAYHTCLYLWARDVERAQQSGQTAEQIAAPAPLAAVLK
jgi:hypothetical protein